MDWIQRIIVLVDTLEAAIGAIEGGTTLHNKLTAARATLLDQITAARMGELDAANIPTDLAVITAYVDELEARLSAARAGYLDNINQAGLLQVTAARAALLDQITAARLAELDAANIPADVDGLKTSRNRQLFSIDFWSVPQVSVVVPIAAANQALPSVVVDIPAGVTVVKATAMFKFRMLGNAGAANKLTNAQHIQIQKAAGAFADAISLVDDQFGIAAATREGGDVVIGDHNVVATVDADETYGFQWTNAIADVAALTFYDVQTGLRIWYSV